MSERDADLELVLAKQGLIMVSQEFYDDLEEAVENLNPLRAAINRELRRKRP